MGVYRGAVPWLSLGGTAISSRTPSSVAAKDAHSRLRNPTLGRSLGSKAYITHSRRSSW